MKMKTRLTKLVGRNVLFMGDNIQELEEGGTIKLIDNGCKGNGRCWDFACGPLLPVKSERGFDFRIHCPHLGFDLCINSDLVNEITELDGTYGAYYQII